MPGIRLSQKEIDSIKQAVHTLDPAAKIYLFGSRADPKKRGGDIDLLVLSSTLKVADKWKILNRIFETLEEQKIDIVIEKDISKTFTQIAFENAVEL